MVSEGQARLLYAQKLCPLTSILHLRQSRRLGGAESQRRRQSEGCGAGGCERHSELTFGLDATSLVELEVPGEERTAC